MDTNVAVVANGRTAQADTRCILACIDELSRIRETRCLLIDNHDLILSEYRDNLRPSGEPGPGDAFFKWLWDNQGYSEHCRRVDIKPDRARGFAEFPTDTALESFDPRDRVFVAVALASGTTPEILNAVDTDWVHHHAALKRAGISVRFCCPHLVSPQE